MTIKNKLSSLLLTSLAAGMLTGCEETIPEQYSADAGNTEIEEVEEFSCYLPEEIINSFENSGSLLNDVLLSEEINLPAGTRIVGMDESYLFAYGPENNASCLDEHLDDEETNLYLTEDCGCWPTIISCSFSDEWRILHEEGLPNGLEECNGFDDNCDGMIDDGFNPDDPITCPEDLILVDNDEFKPSYCVLGFQFCVDGELTECEEFVAPLENELCNLIDDDCDGLVDEEEYPGYWGDCGYSNEGLCNLGTYQCVDGDLICFDAVEPELEACNNLDDDCNGIIDDNLDLGECYTGPSGTLGIGECQAGPLVCENGREVCYDQGPEEEICDGLDNDCDRQVDEDLPDCIVCVPGEILPCQEPSIINELEEVVDSFDCGYGNQICQMDGTWGPCVVTSEEGLVLLDEEAFNLCNNYDDECDGLVDRDSEGNPLSIDCYDGPEGTQDIGICQAGEHVCLDGTWTTECVGQVLPERWDNCATEADENCNGISEEETIYEKVDAVLAIDLSGSMDDLIETVKNALMVYLPAIEGDDHQFAVITFGHPHTHDIYGPGYPFLASQLNSLGDTINYLSTRTETGGSIEPNLDVIYMVTDSSNPLGINWRADATPYLMLFFNEGGAQTNAGRYRFFPYDDVPSAVEAVVNNIEPCQLTGCNSSTNEFWTDGDRFEIDVFVDSPGYYVWQRVAPGRAEDIRSVEENGLSGIDIMDSLLCLDEDSEE